MYLNTSKIPFVSIRDNVTTDDTAITDFKYDNWPSTTTFVPDLNQIKNMKGHPDLKDVNGLFLFAWGTAAADKDMAYKLLGRARMNGPIISLLEGVMTLGTQTMTTHPITGVTISNGLAVDTITVTGGILEDLVDILDTGNNRICMLKIDNVIVNDLYLEVDLDGGADAMTSFYAAVTGY
jgi:hypothetical protein